MLRLRHATGATARWLQLVSPERAVAGGMSQGDLMREWFHPAEWDAGSGSFKVDTGTRLRPADDWPAAEFVAPVPTGDCGGPHVPCVWAAGLNYGRHAAEVDLKAPEHPTLFMKSTGSITGPFSDIVVPKVCGDEVDYEGELAIVIGHECRDVSPERAMDYVLGFTVANDVSARKWQGIYGGGQWCRSKSFDTFLPLGPCLVTPDTLKDLGQDVAIRTRLRKEGTAEPVTVQQASTADMTHSICNLISHISTDST